MSTEETPGVPAQRGGTDQHSGDGDSGDGDGSGSYLSEAEWVSVRRWSAVCATRPPLTQEAIETVAAIFRDTDARRTPHDPTT